MGKRERPKVRREPSQNETVRIGANPDNYLKQTPVWRFSDFDWESAWGHECCVERMDKLREHIESHLSSFETMTWEEILKAAGGRKNGNNSHDIDRDKFKKEAQDRLSAKKILTDSLFSLRLDAGTRIYGVREANCLRIVFFDPHHKNKKKKRLSI